MLFTFSTVYTAIIVSNVLLILLTLFMRNQKIMIQIGYKLLTIFVLFTFIRFLLPIEMPFTKTLLLPEWLSYLISRVRHPLFLLGGYEISLWTFLLLIWAVGFVVKLILYIRDQAKSRYYILSHMWDVTTKERYQPILSKICRDAGKKNPFTIVEVAGLNTPLLYGIFKPHILLPKDNQLTETELHYVLAHEASHHFHHDLVTKLIANIIAMVYWWNPFCHMFVKQTAVILEMRIDDIVTPLDHYDVKDYMECLVNLTEQVAKACPISTDMTMPLLSRSDKESRGDMTKRFEMLLDFQSKKRHLLNLLVLLFVGVMYISSYLFIWEAKYGSSEYLEDTFSAINEDTIYAILRDDNTYDVYYGDLLIENTDSLECYPGIQIYTEKE